MDLIASHLLQVVLQEPSCRLQIVNFAVGEPRPWLEVRRVVFQEAKLVVMMVLLNEVLLVDIRLQEVLMKGDRLNHLSVAVVEGQLRSQLLLPELLHVSLLALELEVVLIQVESRDEGLVAFLNLALAANFGFRLCNGFHSGEIEGCWQLDSLQG